MSKDNNVQLRAYFFIDRMQPQYAAYFGTVTAGDIPVAGMAQLYVEVAPGNEVFRVVDMAVKATEVKPGVQIVEREFGMLEVHSESPRGGSRGRPHALGAARHAGRRSHPAEGCVCTGDHQRVALSGPAHQPFTPGQHAGSR